MHANKANELDDNHTKKNLSEQKTTKKEQVGFNADLYHPS